MPDDSGMDLDAFIGEWSIEAGFPDAPEGTASFEWILGGRFVLQREEHTKGHLEA